MKKILKENWVLVFGIFATVITIVCAIIFGDKGVWLVAPLESEGDRVFSTGPDLTDLVEEDLVYTYYDTKVWVALKWEGYLDGMNVWSIPDALKEEKPDWASNESWTLDFWWIDSRGEPPAGSYVGTSSE